MSLLELPTELLLPILEHLDEAAINALAQTNHALYRYLNDHLYEHNIEHFGGVGLIWAAAKGKLATVKRFLQLEADPNIFVTGWEKAKQFPLDRSIIDLPEDWLVVQSDTGNNSVVTKTMIPPMIIDRWRNGTYSWLTNMHGPPLLSAIRGSHKDVAKLLLSREDIHTRRKDGCGGTALHLAASRNQIEIMKLLLERDGLFISERSKGGWSYSVGQTPLGEAVSKGHEGIVRLLLEQEVSHREKVDILREAWHQGPRISKLLLNATLNSRLRIMDPNAGLDEAASFGDTIGLQIILHQKDVQPDCRSRAEKLTPLALAVRQGHLKIAAILLATGKVDVNSRDKDGNTPLFHAALKGDDRVVDFLLAQGAEPYARNKYGKIAAHFALEGGKKELCKRLKGHIRLEESIECLLR